MLALGLASLLYVSPHLLPQRGNGALMLAGELDGPEIDMSALASRIQAVQQRPPQAARLLDLDAMVPGQRLEFQVPETFVDMIDQLEADERGDVALVMVGRARLSSLNTHGVECKVERLVRHPEGGADAVLAAERVCEVVDVGPDEGSRWLGRSATVHWLNLDATAPEEVATPKIMAEAELLEELVVDWLKLVRETGRERQPKQLEQVILDLGQIPPATKPSARALWVAGLINPLPALGVALEIRPAVLMAPTAELRVKAADMGIRDSIARLSQPGPLF